MSNTLPPTLSAEEVARVWGISSWCVYQGAKAGTLPVGPLKLGRLLRWSTVEVYRSVGLEVSVGVTSPQGADLGDVATLLTVPTEPSRATDAR
jgi:predicted DNA-binding transcriptional regulator AlpA